MSVRDSSLTESIVFTTDKSLVAHSTICGAVSSLMDVMKTTPRVRRRENGMICRYVRNQVQVFRSTMTACCGFLPITIREDARESATHLAPERSTQEQKKECRSHRNRTPHAAFSAESVSESQCECGNHR